MLEKLNKPDIGILIIRVAVGLVFLLHGWGKLQNTNGVVVFFATLGLPAFVAYLIMIIETVGGFLMILGFFVRYIALLFVGIMLGVFVFTKAGKGNFMGHELEFTLLAASLAIAFLGSGMCSIQAKLKKSA